jgi:2-polyprenyl-6-methoxyphenol hydroxylase-like FAD-dependent oxidoreductase
LTTQSIQSNLSTALVLGASIAGLWTARVLADHFDQVLILDRDRLPEGPEPRPGVPQARQYHILLLRGLQILRVLFPGSEEELIAAGAVPFDVTDDVRVRSRGRWLRQFPSGMCLLSCSRILLEATLRRRLRQNPRIRFVEGVAVKGLVADHGAARVTGVRFRHRAGDETNDETMAGDLVVDALGRRSPTPIWLAELGYAPPEETVVDAFLGYVTRHYRQPADFHPGWRMLMVTSTPPDQRRGGIIFPEENNTWVVMMSGTNKDYPPTDEEGFNAFAHSIDPEYSAAVEAAEPIGKPLGYRGTESRWRHYEKLERWPQRYVVLGDAFCGFNPVYGQGMTVAALSAVALGEELTRAGGRLDDVAKSSVQAIAKITAGAWLLATGADLEWPGTVGQAANGPGDRLARWYLDRLLAALEDDKVRTAFNEVNQLVKPASRLFAPDVALRVLARR